MTASSYATTGSAVSRTLPVHVLFAEYTTPLGGLLVARTDYGVCRATPAEEGIGALVAWTERHLPRALLDRADAPDPTLQLQLDEYFAGALRGFTLDMDLYGAPLQRAIWQEVADIPYAETRSYAGIAVAIGRPGVWRAVATAMRECPAGLFIPCHRVIGADGTVRGDTDGPWSRQRLLHFERSVCGQAAFPPAPRHTRRAEKSQE